MELSAARTNDSGNMRSFDLHEMDISNGQTTTDYHITKHLGFLD
jgi:hypothetical protein